MEDTNLKYYYRFLSAIILLSLLSKQVAAQKVGLVLSGGGAKGLAHLGVLKALEENKIPIDYVVGTSMGGVIGAFYAAGYTIEEMEAIVYSEAFQDWVSGHSQKIYDYFLYQEADDASILSLKFGLDSSFHLSLTSSIVKDFALNFALAELLARASSLSEQSFDSLLVPFRCVASDIFTQEEIILRRGLLSDAVRASLNVPIFFKPVKVNNKYLFDGGIYNNFPVDIAQEEFATDVIIGVNVSSKTYNQYPYEEDENLVANANPLIYMWVSKSDSSQLDSASIYIQPKLEEHSVFDFGEVKQMVQKGYEETLIKISEIKQKISRRQSQETLQEKRQIFREKLPPLKLQEVSIQGLNPAAHKYARRILQGDSAELGVEKIKKQFFRLAKTDKFTRLYPTFVFDKQSQAFDFKLKAKTDKSVVAKIGGNLSSRNISQLYLGLGYDFVSKFLYTTRVNLYTGQFYFSTEAKTQIHIPTQVPFYIEPKITYNQWDYTNMSAIFSRRSRRNEIILSQRDTKIGLNIGLAAGRKGKILAHGGYFFNNYRYTDTPSISLQDTLDFTQFRGQVFQISYEKNNLNRRFLASEGQHFESTIQYVRGQEKLFPGSNSPGELSRTNTRSWLRVKLRQEKYFNFGRYSLGYLLEGVLSNQVRFQNYTSTLAIAPAFYPLIDSRSLFLRNFRAFNYTALGLKNIIHLKSYWEIRAEAYAFGAFQPILENPGSITQANRFKNYWSGSLGLVYHSVLGPMSLHINYYNESTNPLGFILNIGIITFNKKALE